VNFVTAWLGAIEYGDLQSGETVVIGGGSAEGGAVERHMIGFQAVYARRGVKLELGERLALGYQFQSRLPASRRSEKPRRIRKRI
jgi:hypothetical protein